MFFTTLVRILAEEAEPPPAQGDDLFRLLPMFALVAAAFIFMVFLPQRKERQARQAMLGALKKNDRVLTIGGMFATVANISDDGKEVTLKVDDNTRIRMLRSSIQQVFAEGESNKAAEPR